MKQPVRVGYQGAHGTFSEMAVHQFFQSEKFEAANYTNFSAIIKDVEEGVIDYALLPVENTTTGIIYRTYDLLKDSSIFAVGEVNVRINENLIGFSNTPLEEIKEVYSHPEPLDQCQGFFAAHPWMKPIAYQDTAKSVEYITACQDKSKAALASSLAAKYYKMPVLVKNVQDNQLNTTRFFCVCNGQREVEKANKMSLYFVVNHQPGALFEVIKIFANRGINILKLESRPIRGRLFEYCFYLDFDGCLQHQKTQEAIEEVLQHCLELKVLGSYKKAKTE